MENSKVKHLSAQKAATKRKENPNNKPTLHLELVVGLITLGCENYQKFMTTYGLLELLVMETSIFLQTIFFISASNFLGHFLLLQTIFLGFFIPFPPLKKIMVCSLARYLIGCLLVTEYSYLFS